MALSTSRGFNGGNHYLENLISLIIGSIQFDNKYSNKIFTNSIKNLKFELDSQILTDGGHEERSAAYHILILERLVELGFVLEIVQKYNPIWLKKTIIKMLNWLILIRLEKGNIPLFNDSPRDIYSDLDSTRDFAIAYINSKTDDSLSGLRNN